MAEAEAKLKKIRQILNEIALELAEARAILKDEHHA
jgi:hypothetical protein